MTAHDVHWPSSQEEIEDQPAAGQPADRRRRSRPRGARPVRPARPPLSPARAAVVATSMTAVALGLWFIFFALVLSGLQESHTQHVMYSQLRQELAEATVPIGGAIKHGTPIAYIDIPAIGLQAVTVEGTSSADLAKGPGHLPSTPLPGQAGNSQIYGRSAMYGAPFRGVHDLRRGDIIFVTTGQAVLEFGIIDVRGPGSPLPSAAQLGQSSLTLVTSAGSGWRDGWAPDHVIYADATLAVGKMQPTPPGRPTAVPAVDNPLAGDTGELVLLPYLVLFLVLLCAALAWAYTRWTAWQLWIVALPTVTAMLWIATNSAMLLLPNLA